MKENNIGRWSGKDKRLDGAVSYLLPAAAGFTPLPFSLLYEFDIVRKRKARQIKTNRKAVKLKVQPADLCWKWGWCLRYPSQVSLIACRSS